MGRKKRRRLRGRDLGPGTAVETVEFEVDPAPEAGLQPDPVETPQHVEAGASPAIRVEPAQPSETGDEPPPEARPPDPIQEVQTLGELLQQAREDRGLSLEAASARTRISTQMLRHLENDCFGEFAADAYVKGFLRNYGGFLGLDIGMLLRRYEAISGRLVERDPEILELDLQPRSRRRRRLRPLRWPTLIFLLLAALVWVFWSRGAARLGLRPQPGLEQIEEELRDSSRPLSVPGLVPSQPSILLPEPQSTPEAALPSAESSVPPAAFPASEHAPLPASSEPHPVTPTQRRPPGGDASNPPTAPAPPPEQPLEDLAPPGRP